MDRRLKSVAFPISLAWLGILFHDLQEFGRPAIENSIVMGVIAILLFWLWRRLPERRGAIAIVLLGYAIISLVGAVTSVFPLSIWPFDPEQSLEHYLSHTIWTISALPLVWEMTAYGSS
jgi:hypothetical protein